jgi:hypothetical protein
VLVVGKFSRRVWTSVIVMPLVVVLQRLVRRYYDQLEASLHKPGKSVSAAPSRLSFSW